VKRDLLSIHDLTPDEVGHVIDRAIKLKSGTKSNALAGKSVALLFEKPSLRTRASFHVGIDRLGGYSFYLGKDEVGFGGREPISDMAQVLERYVDCLVARVFAHDSLEQLSKYASITIINALSDWEHPCQALADLQTITERKGSLKGRKVCFVGDGNNVARSLALAASGAGAEFCCASPQGYELDQSSLIQAQERGANSGGRALQLSDPQEAVKEADVVYTDVWTSMGQEEETAIRLKAFQGYQVDPELLSLAKPDAIFMHDMPAHYGEEVPPGMLEHSQSVAFDQAENRLHAQAAVMEFLLTSAS
jgi:ornithine carbamoyltransferase